MKNYGSKSTLVQKVEILFVVVLIVILILMLVSFLNTWSQ